MNIGRLLKGENKWTSQDGTPQESDVLDIRTTTFRKRYTLSVNIKKHSSGKVIPSQVKEEDKDKPDWHIWWNPSNRGESLPSEIVGSLKLSKSEKGLIYQRGSIQDPTFDGGVMWISVFVLTEDDKKTQLNHHGNIVLSAPRKQQNNNQNGYSQQEMAQPTYDIEYQDPQGNVIHTETQINHHAQTNNQLSPAKTDDDSECPF